MRVLFVRHGQMDFGDDSDEPLVLDAPAINQWFNAEREEGLSHRGRDEAATVARYLLKHPVDAVYSSQLLRARQTAEATALRLGLRVNVTEDLMELRPGNLSNDGPGYAWLRFLGRLPLPDQPQRKLVGGAMIQLYFSAWLAGRTTGGESRAAFEARLQRVFDGLRATHAPDARVALFAHGYVIFYLSGWLTAPGWPRRSVLLHPHVRNGGITELELGPTGPPRLIRYADAAHL